MGADRNRKQSQNTVCINALSSRFKTKRRTGVGGTNAIRKLRGKASLPYSLLIGVLILGRQKKRIFRFYVIFCSTPFIRITT